MNESKLVKLIATLTKSEKRSFKLFIGRTRNSGSELKQIMLFDIIEQYENFNDRAIEKKLPDLTKKNVYELGQILYRNILRSLRITHSNEIENTIREKIEYSSILYKRGLFFDSLELLSQGKKIAKAHQRHFLLYEIIDFEKKIESRHVTNSHEQRASELTIEAITIRETLESEGYWTELSLQLYDFYLKSGHTRNEEERNKVDHIFKNGRPVRSTVHNPLFYEQLYFCQSHVWYNYITQNFTLGYKYAVKWIELFSHFPIFIESEKFQLLKGFHNCLSVLYYCQDLSRFEKYHQKMIRFIRDNEHSFDENTHLIAFSYKHLAELNLIVMRGTFSESKVYLMNLEAELSEMKYLLDHHRLMIFQYKMATIYFTMGDNRKCLQLLNQIIHDNQKSLHEDVQSFARILNLIAHYELGNVDLIFFQVKSVYRFLLNLQETQEIQKEIISFLRKLVNVPVDKVPLLFETFYFDLQRISKNKYENRAFLYLDILSWLESKIQSRPVEEVIKSKRNYKLEPKEMPVNISYSPTDK